MIHKCQHIDKLSLRKQNQGNPEMPWFAGRLGIQVAIVTDGTGQES